MTCDQSVCFRQAQQRERERERKERERGKREMGKRERERKERAFCLLLSKEEEAGEVHYLLIKRPPMPITTVTPNTRIPFRRIFNWEIGPMKYFYWTFQ